jgi:hypothetical protein
LKTIYSLEASDSISPIQFLFRGRNLHPLSPVDFSLISSAMLYNAAERLIVTISPAQKLILNSCYPVLVNPQAIRDLLTLANQSNVKAFSHTKLVPLLYLFTKCDEVADVLRPLLFGEITCSQLQDLANWSRVSIKEMRTAYKRLKEFEKHLLLASN